MDGNCIELHLYTKNNCIIQDLYIPSSASTYNLANYNTQVATLFYRRCFTLANCF